MNKRLNIQDAEAAEEAQRISNSDTTRGSGKLIEAKELESSLQRLPASKPRIYRAPGRVNLIGEHTDYNDGFVMPAAIDFSTWVTVSTRRDRVISVFSQNFGEHVRFGLDDPAPQPKGQ